MAGFVNVKTDYRARAKVRGPPPGRSLTRRRAEMPTVVGSNKSRSAQEPTAMRPRSGDAVDHWTRLARELDCVALKVAGVAISPWSRGALASGLRVLGDRMPDPSRRRGHREICYAERRKGIDHCIHDRCWYADRARLATAFGAERVVRAERLMGRQVESRHLVGPG